MIKTKLLRKFDWYCRANDNVPKACTIEKFQNLLDAEEVAVLTGKIRKASTDEERQKLKAQLPAICWHGHCTSETRRKTDMVPSGLAMLDLDGVFPTPSLPEEAADALHSADRPQWIDDLMKRIDKQIAELGICLIHVTPSGQGLRIVGDMSVLDCHTIEEWQKKMTVALDLQQGEAQGFYHIDTCVKDLSRLSFVVPRSEVLCINEELLWQAPSEEWTYDFGDNGQSFQYAAQTNGQDMTGSTAGPVPTPDSEEADDASTFTYNGHTLTEIAEKWLLVYGRPVIGERHRRYFEMVTLFKNICERDPKVLFAQLPDFGKPADERWAMVNDAIRRQPGHALDPDFRSFLITYGFKEPEKTMRDIRLEQSTEMLTAKVLQDEADRKAQEAQEQEILEVEAEEMNDPTDDWGRYPSVYNIYRRILPPHLRKPSVLALDCIMGTYFTNLTAQYINKQMERPCFHNIIVGPPASGKGNINHMHKYLTAPLRDKDLVSLNLHKKYEAEAKRMKGARELPEEPDQHIRLLEMGLSHSSLLQRQSQAGGLHQLMFCTELDSLYREGGHKRYDDTYRCAYEMEEMSQYYLWNEGFNGRVIMMLNILATGTPEQFSFHYPNPENGLISRINWYRITEMFIKDFIPKDMTEREKAYINRVINFAMSLSYGEDEDGKEIILPPKDITKEMEFMIPVCQKFLNEQLTKASNSMDQSRDQFRKRIAIDMYRGAMVDWGCALGKLDDRRRKIISEFRLAKAEEMIETKVAEFGDMVNRPVRVNSCHYGDLFEAMPAEFSTRELAQKAIELNVKSEAKVIVNHWKKAGKIDSKERGLYTKKSQRRSK